MRKTFMGADGSTNVVDTSTGAVVAVIPPGGNPAAAAAAGGFISTHPNAFPDPNQVNQMYGPMQPGTNADAFDDDLYDTQSISSATAAVKTFFLASNSDRSQSSQIISGQLPNQEMFYIKYIGIEYWNDSVTATVANNINEIAPLFYGLSYVLTIGNKPYAQGDGFKFLNPNAPLAVDTAVLSLVPYRKIALRIPIVIVAQSTFNCAVTIKSTTLAATNNYLKVRLSGIHYRDVQ